jgi:hypothetical protein
MCTYSMIVDARYDDWQRRYPYSTTDGVGSTIPPILTPAPVPVVSPQELEEFRRLLERAREYDRAHGEPDCELEEKRRRIKDLAEKLGVKVEFV